MRPRHKAAENLVDAADVELVLVASMRPRHKAAENIHGNGEAGGTAACFNEAAA